MPKPIAGLRGALRHRAVLLIPLVAGMVLMLQGSIRLLATFDIGTFAVNGFQRLLVLAPHCDDETLGAGGVIQEALHAGMQVKVVMETNGDGSITAAIQDFRRINPNHTDFIRMGNLRQGETLAALGQLGLPADQVDFLSFPDRGTPDLWNINWSVSNPYRSPYSGLSKSTYQRTFDPKAVYSGEDLLGDLETILESYRPDLIIYPNPEDVHRDHWGLSAFTRLALAEIQHADPTYQPTTYTYLVHRPDFPRPMGFHPEANLQPPPALQMVSLQWFQVYLSPAEILQKATAIRDYHTQFPLLRTLLLSFVRQNELFSQVPTASLPVLSSGNPTNPVTWRDASGQAIAPVQRDPVRDFITRQLVGSDDLTAFYAARDAANNVQLCIQVRTGTQAALRYTLRILAAQQSGVAHFAFSNHRIAPNPGVTDLSLSLDDSFACGQVSLDQLGNTWALFLGADVEQIGIGILDQIAWQLVMVK